MRKPEAAVALIHAALEAGIKASCVLMDTRFTNGCYDGRTVRHGLKFGREQVERMYEYNGQRGILGERSWELRDLLFGKNPKLRLTI